MISTDTEASSSKASESLCPGDLPFLEQEDQLLSELELEQLLSSRTFMIQDLLYQVQQRAETLEKLDGKCKSSTTFNPSLSYPSL